MTARPAPAAGADVPARADVVVVGAGAAGCVVARRAAEAGLVVVLLEAGAHRAPRAAGLLDIGPTSRVVSRVPATLGGERIDLPRGRTPGGSGAVNGGYCLPARAVDLAGWPAPRTGPDWASRYAAGLERAISRLRPVTAPADPVARRLAAAFPGGEVEVGQARRGDERVTALDAWDPMGAGARLVTGAEAVELRWAGGEVGGRCDGVVVRVGGDDDEAPAAVLEIAAREVVLAAGTVGTATLLRRSGLGPATGHPVGESVEEHPEVLLEVAGEFAGDGGTERGGGAGGGTDAAAGSIGGTGSSGVARARPALLSRVVRLAVSDTGVSAGAAGRGDADEVELRPYSVPLHVVVPGLAPQPHRIGIALMTPRGRGRILVDPARAGARTVPGEASGPGAAAAGAGPGAVVDLDAHPDPHDDHVLTRAADAVRERLGQGGRVVRSTSQHLSGAARIGEVVDDGGRLLGATGVRVVDASALPRLPRCGPYLSVLAVAEDLAGVLVRDLVG